MVCQILSIACWSMRSGAIHPAAGTCSSLPGCEGTYALRLAQTLRSSSMNRPIPTYFAYPFAAALVLFALFNGGCASKPVQAQWTDPQFANHSLRGAKVLVVCDSN